jgi:hypothetical protein
MLVEWDHRPMLSLPQGKGKLIDWVGSLLTNKRYRKLKGQSRMDKLETLATLDTKETGRRLEKHKNTTQKTKKMSNQKPWSTPGSCEE